MICEWRIFSVILYHCCATLQTFFLGWVGEGWSKKHFINKMFPNKPKNYVECTIKMHTVYSRYIAHKLKYFKSFFVLILMVTTCSLGKLKMQYLKKFEYFLKDQSKKDLQNRNVQDLQSRFNYALNTWWGSFCTNYCFNLAWHRGDQPVALLRRYWSPGCFDSGLQLVCIVWSDVTYLPLDNIP